MRGYSLIECIIAIGLFGLTSALTTRFLQSSCSQLGIVTSALEQRLAITKSAAILTSSLSALERTHLSLVVSVTDGSNPKAPHGGPHPVRAVGATSKPRSDSDILSSIELDPVYQARIVETRPGSTEVTIKACGGSSIPNKDQFRSHILLGLGGACQVTGSPEKLSNGCFLLRGTPVHGLINDSATCPGGSYHEYRPVSREISLFIDRSGEFRLISHVGLRLLENQPITRGLRELTISPLTITSGALFFRVSLRGSLSKKHRFLFAAAMTSGSLWNEVLL